MLNVLICNHRGYHWLDDYCKTEAHLCIPEDKMVMCEPYKGSGKKKFIVFAAYYHWVPIVKAAKTSEKAKKDIFLKGFKGSIILDNYVEEVPNSLLPREYWVVFEKESEV